MIDALNGEESVERIFFSVVVGLTIKGLWVSSFHRSNDSVVLISRFSGFFSLGENSVEEGEVLSIVTKIIIFRIKLRFNKSHGRLSSTV